MYFLDTDHFGVDWVGVVSHGTVGQFWDPVSSVT